LIINQKPGTNIAGTNSGSYKEQQKTTTAAPNNLQYRLINKITTEANHCQLLILLRSRNEIFQSTKFTVAEIPLLITRQIFQFANPLSFNYSANLMEVKIFGFCQG
jgi:hypothetical protein